MKLFLGQNDVKVSLDCSVAEFITPERAVISLKGWNYIKCMLVNKVLFTNKST